MRTGVLFLAVLLGLTGCKSAKNNPPGFTGVWAVAAVDHVDRSSGTLELKSDGSFIADRLPTDLIGDAGPFSEDNVSGAGTWSLKHDGDGNLVMLRFTRMKAVDHPPLPYDAEVFSENVGDGLQLYIKDGDPDEDERTILRRTDEEL